MRYTIIKTSLFENVIVIMPASILMPWYSSDLAYAIYILVSLLLLYFIRKYEKNRQLHKHRAEKNDFLKGVLENAPFAIAVTDDKGHVTTINEMFKIKFGYDEDEIIDKSLDILLTTEESVKNAHKESYKTLKEHEKIYTVCKRKSKDGEVYDIELFTTPNFIEGKQFGYLLFYNDITKRLKAEEDLEKTFIKFRQVLDTLQDAYFEADSKGFLTYVNQKLVEATKYLNKDEIMGKHFRHLISSKTSRPFVENFITLYKTGKPIEPFETTYLTKEGKEYTSEIVASPIIENGKIVGTRGIIRDISIRVKAEEMLREAKEAAEYRVEELASINRIAEKVSHTLDLQDILNSVCIELTKIFPVRSAGISLLNPEKSRLEVMAFYSTDSSEEDYKGKILFLEGNIEAQNMVADKKTILIEDSQSDPRTKPFHNLSKLKDSMSYMIVPLITRGEVIGTIGMPAQNPDYEFRKNEIELAETIASQFSTAIDNARLHAQTERALDAAEQDLEIGREIQSGFFPQDLPAIPGWDIHTYFKAARQVSGDFYDVFPVGQDGRLAIVIADVCDKGVGAALFMVLLRSLIRSYSEQNQDNITISNMLSNISERVNGYIVNIHGQSNMFATLVIGILDSASNELYYVNGGHEPPILIDSEGNIKMELEPTGAAFGFSDDLPFEVEKIEFLPNDLLLSFTDGLTDAKDSGGNFYSEERLKMKLVNKWESAFSLIKHLEIDVAAHIGAHGQFDDITMVAIRRTSNNKKLKHKLKHKAAMENLPVFRNFSVEACELLNLSEDITETLKLAVDEICSNIIMHGYKETAAEDISLSVSASDQEALVQIEDTGQPFDPSYIDPPDLSDNINEREIGGLGLFFVKEMVDEINYKSKNGINCLVLKMKF